MPDIFLIPVCCAIIEHEGKVLIAQRHAHTSNAYYWEFPGGKQEENESAEECLIREIREELSVKIHIKEQLKPVVHHYPDKSIELIPFVCNYDGSPVKPEEHKKVLWIQIEQFGDFQWSAADVKVWEQYINRFRK
ncbi:MAG: (deoxy)nucleoside triphosphate pyrophosphohydrolase [Bacteroidetes bacterium]|nr:MAG: (deoxy)nucleoside triphosphate pyrophosphohydrolase [Bacteroidota bacterium]